jgi:prolyl oligopeptidase
MKCFAFLACKYRILHGSLWAASLVVSASGLTAALDDIGPYPETRTVDTVHTYGAIQLADPFAWLEADETEEAEAWFRKQDAFTRSLLGGLSERSALYEEIKEIDNAKTVKIYSFNRSGERYFYLKQELGEEVGSLYYRDGIEGTEHLILDPEAFTDAEGVQALQYYRPSSDGKRVGVGIATGGSEIPDLYIFDVESGEQLGERIDRVRGGFSWMEDSSGFFYTQMRPVDPDEPPAARYTRQPVKFHRLGTDPAEDRIMASFDERPLPGLKATDFLYLLPIWETNITAAYISHGVDQANTLFMTRNFDVEDPGSTVWQPVVSRDDKVQSFDRYEDRLFLMTHKDAPRRKILEASVDNYDREQLQVLLPEGEYVLTGMSVVGDYLYVTAMEAGIDLLLKLDLREGTGGFERVELPLIGRVTLLANDYREKDLYMSLTSWIQAPAYYRLDPESGEVTLSPLRPQGPYDAPEGLVARRVYVPSYDGVEIPLTLIHREDLQADGNHPTILYGYGAYGTSLRPAFSPLRLPWYERGGIYAVAHVRGGGEYGKEWHDGGHLETKRNSWLDLHACAEYLIDEGWTKSEHLGAMAGSMGGVLVGRAMTSRPELYGAIVSRVGNHNPVRNHMRANGPGNYPEYGNPLDPEEFPYALAMDSYFAVRDDVKYPPMLLTTGYNDARVDPWMPGKMAARLQQLDTEGGPFLLRVDFDAGHGGVARSDIWSANADIYAFFWDILTERPLDGAR